MRQELGEMVIKKRSEKGGWKESGGKIYNVIHQDVRAQGKFMIMRNFVGAEGTEKIDF